MKRKKEHRRHPCLSGADLTALRRIIDTRKLSHEEAAAEIGVAKTSVTRYLKGLPLRKKQKTLVRAWIAANKNPAPASTSVPNRRLSVQGSIARELKEIKAEICRIKALINRMTVSPTAETQTRKAEIEREIESLRGELRTLLYG